MQLYNVGTSLLLLAVTWVLYRVNARFRQKKGSGPPKVPYYLPFGLDNMWELSHVLLVRERC